MSWYPQAVIEAGPTAKQQAGTNPAAGVVLHSAVGFKSGLLQELRRPTSERTAAWHFSVLQDGTVLQHYPLTAVLWHCSDGPSDKDGVDGNGTLIGIEHEGGFDPTNEPLTPAQRSASVALVLWIAGVGGWTPSRTTNKTLFEHKEIADKPTECPSGRIPWPAYLIAPVPSYTADQEQMLDYLASPHGQGLSLAEHKRLLISVGLPPEAAPVKPAGQTPIPFPQPVPVPTQPAFNKADALRLAEALVAELKK